MRGTSSLLAAALMLALSAAAAAASGSSEESQLPKFSAVDQDGNSKLSLEEAKAVGVGEETFKEEDLDDDGKLTKYDYKYGVK